MVRDRFDWLDCKRDKDFQQAMIERAKLTEPDFKAASSKLGVPVATVQAVAAVESRGAGFLSNGEPKILFERHKFSLHTGGKFDKSHPDISNPVAGGYGPESAQHKKLQRAVSLDRDAALKSASWGMFQILGENYRQAGFSTLQGFVNAMYAGEPEHLQALVNFIKADKKMWDALKNKDWAGFARRYNGPAYKKYNYDTKLERAYLNFGGT